MYKKQILSLMLFLFGTITFAGEFAHIQKESILKKERAVARYIRTAAYKRFVFITAGVAAMGYASYSFFAPAPQPISPTPLLPVETPPLNPDQPMLATTVLSKISQLDAKLDRVEVKVEHMDITMTSGQPQTFGQGVKKFVKETAFTIFTMACVNGALYPFAKYLAKVDRVVDTFLDSMFFTIDINWYLRSHTSLLTTCTLLQTYAMPIKEHEMVRGLTNPQLLIDSWTMVTQQIEGVLGFLHYKASVLRKKTPAQATSLEHFANDLKNYVDSTVTTLEEKSQAQQWEDMHTTLVNFNAELRNRWVQCALIEHAKL